MAKVAFTGSFDPPHVGHIYVIEEAKRLGFEVIVVVANNASKTYNSSLEDRLELARIAFSRCVVYSSDSDNIGTLIKNKGCDAIIRGLRDENDFKYEQQVADWNRENNNLETIFVACPPMLRNVSSTKIRATQNNA